MSSILLTLSPILLGNNFQLKYSNKLQKCYLGTFFMFFFMYVFRDPFKKCIYVHNKIRKQKVRWADMMKRKTNRKIVLPLMSPATPQKPVTKFTIIERTREQKDACT